MAPCTHAKATTDTIAYPCTRYSQEAAAVKTIGSRDERRDGSQSFQRLDEITAETANLENKIADEYAAMIDEGFDPQIARAAIRRFNDRLSALREERATLERHRTATLAAARSLDVGDAQTG